MDASEVQCAAVVAAPIAEAVAWERALLDATSGRATREASSLTRRVLSFRQEEIRNEAAVGALKAFYLLAEVEAGRELLRRSVAILDGAIEDVDQGGAQGVGTVRRQARQVLIDQRMDAVAKWIETDLLREQLNGQLRQLIGLPYDDPLPIWPAADLEVTAESVDTGRAIELGLSQRTDIKLLEILLRNLNRQTLPVVEAALRQIDGALGVPSPRQRAALVLFGKHKQDTALSYRRQQLQKLLCTKRQAVAEEIRQAMLAVDSAAKQASVANERLGNRREQLIQEAEETVPGQSTLETSKGQLEAIEAERELVHQAVVRRIAEVELARALGMSAVEGGLGNWQANCCPSTGAGGPDQRPDPDPHLDTSAKTNDGPFGPPGVADTVQPLPLVLRPERWGDLPPAGSSHVGNPQLTP
jgi:hypothetical protein